MFQTRKSFSHQQAVLPQVLQTMVFQQVCEQQKEQGVPCKNTKTLGSCFTCAQGALHFSQSFLTPAASRVCQILLRLMSIVNPAVLCKASIFSLYPSKKSRKIDHALHHQFAFQLYLNAGNLLVQPQFKQWPNVFMAKVVIDIK